MESVYRIIFLNVYFAAFSTAKVLRLSCVTNLTLLFLKFSSGLDLRENCLKKKYFPMFIYLLKLQQEKNI